jgi:hypothetical protein
MGKTPRCMHGRTICSECVIVRDEGKRAADIVNGYCAFVPWDERIRSVVIIRLSDGGSDGNLYMNKRDAVRGTGGNEFQYAYFYFRNSPQGTTPKDMQLWIEYHRGLYAAGARLPDPDDMHGGPDPIIPATREQYLAQRNGLILASPGKFGLN